MPEVPRGRLNAPNVSYGVVYQAREPAGAFAQTFLPQPGPTLIDTVLLSWKAYVRLLATVDWKLIKLAGTGLASVAATAEVTHAGLRYDVPSRQGPWHRHSCAP